MNLNELIADARTSITGQGIDNRAYSRTLRHLRRYSFWEGAEDAPCLWEHQQAAIATVVAYLHGDKQIPERPEHTEAALLKLCGAEHGAHRHERGHAAGSPARIHGRVPVY